MIDLEELEREGREWDHGQLLRAARQLAERIRTLEVELAEARRESEPPQFSFGVSLAGPGSWMVGLTAEKIDEIQALLEEEAARVRAETVAMCKEKVSVTVSGDAVDFLSQKCRLCVDWSAVDAAVEGGSDG